MTLLLDPPEMLRKEKESDVSCTARLQVTPLGNVGFPNRQDETKIFMFMHATEKCGSDIVDIDLVITNCAIS